MVPAVNQIEVHPYFGNDGRRAPPTEAHGILTEAWSPIAQGRRARTTQTIVKIAEHGRHVRRPR